MVRKIAYETKKRRIQLTLSDLCIEWLINQKQELTASSLSDTLEKLSRAELK